jgi:hypothetical protein
MAYYVKRKWPTGNAPTTSEPPWDGANLSWQNADQAYADDNSFTYVSWSTFDAGSNTNIVRYGGFQFGTGLTGTTGTASSGSTHGTNNDSVYDPIVLGIAVYINKFTSAGRGGDSLVQLTVDGTVGYGSNKASSGTWGSAGGGAGTLGTAGTYTYGGSRDLWGTTFTWAQVCGAGFGVRFAGSAMANNTQSCIGNLSVGVWYEPAPGEYMEMSPRRGRFPVSPDNRITAYGKEWRKVLSLPDQTAGTSVFASTNLSTAGTTGVAGTQCIWFSAGTFYYAGTVVMQLGSAGTVKLDEAGFDCTFGTGREVYFCNTAGTTKAIPNGPFPFTHYWINTRGYSSTSFTYGTSPVGTAGTQINHAGTAGTHMFWVKWLP